MTIHHYDVAIVGGGVIGAAVAFELAKRQHRVAILEKGTMSAEASSAAAGMLGAQAEFSAPSPLVPFALKSRALMPSLVEELKGRTGIDIGLVENGMIKIAATDEEVDELRRHYAFWRATDQPVRWLTKEEALEMEPRLAAEAIVGAMYIEGDGQVSAPDLASALAHAAASAGARLYEHTEVVNIRSDAGGHLIDTTGGTFAAGAVVIATGAWASRLGALLGLSLSVYPVKGECVMVRTSVPLLKATVFAKNGCYIVPKRGNQLLIGATSAPGTYDRRVSAGGVMSLLHRAARLLPDVQQAEWVRAWSGIRPQTKDGLPYIGEHPERRGLFVAAGHYRNGILLSAITGRLMADLVERKELGVDLSPFSLTRHTEEKVGIE
ncbi:glycine oxidase [Geobacillus subterraneus]|uniref:glycine oxidase n=2 Tax=Geobacillus TaxID=129337 RepID=A0ABM6ADQ5_9BACL|nr:MULTISPECIES: glycine oxidase ThiO [Geobacillus]AMX84486.1 glycine oxidase [Geobacillus subterraneus]KZS24271.1 glycine oxidase ThiO [Geobacillus subterraneus]OXB87527.1 glycine oxidase ThiO [Geobacillus uzenensis]WPZ18977.1 glycine oxidase ThiO [Geobacillus subterraneus]